MWDKMRIILASQIMSQEYVRDPNNHNSQQSKNKIAISDFANLKVLARDGQTTVAYGALVDDGHIVTAASVDLAEVAFARLGAEVVPVVQPEEFSSPIGEFLRLVPLEKPVDGILHKTVCLPERDEADGIRYAASAGHWRLLYWDS